MNIRIKVLLAPALGLPLMAASIGAQQGHTHAHEVGDHQVHFPISCTASLQAEFNRAVAILHSFGYEEARRQFQWIGERDPACGMAHWGIAMSYWHPLWAAPTREEFAAGREAADRAARIGARTERERDYISAITTFYDAAKRLDHSARALAYRDAMRQVSAEYPDDAEARVFLALGILGSAPPADSSFAHQREAASILDTVLAEYPRHPGVAHYTIHAFDHPELAELALPAARVYAEIAPSSPHALHMPTHIFTRLGLWRESIESNLACRDAAEAVMARLHPGVTAFESIHCLDYLAYAHLQLGQDNEAGRAVDALASMREFDEPNFAVGYAVAAAPARYALERRDWSAAANLPLPDLPLPWHEYPYALGSAHFANAIGAARSGDVEAARAAVARLQALHGGLREDPPGGPYDWAGQVESLKLVAGGWLAFAEGRPDEAVRVLTAGAEKEERVGKHPVTPGALLPARELLGDLLLELERPAEALKAYQVALRNAPRRFRALLGAARAAHAAGEAGEAARYYGELVELAGPSTTRAEAIAEARGFLAGRRRAAIRQ